jgi:hypothetical protein
MKKHLLFLFMAQGNATPGSTSDWKPDHLCAEHYHTAFHREGYFVMLEKLLEKGCFDELTIIFESNRGHGVANWVDHPNARCLVIPEIKYAEQFITDETIIFVRGGFKHWHDWLLKYKGKNWLMLYSANTGRQKWLWWDIILDDILMQHTVDKHGRYMFPFIKPIDDEFYLPDKSAKQVFDVCIGASHVHDKKGQWRVWEVLKAYVKLFDESITAVLPGSPRRGAKTVEMLDQIYRKCPEKIVISHIGHVHKEELVKVYQRSKVAMFLGSHGQNDRGPLEASSCGCLVGIGSPAYHTCLLKHPCLSFTPIDIDDYDLIAMLLKKLLDGCEKGRMERAECFRNKLGFFKSWFTMMCLLDMLWTNKPTVNNKARLMKHMKHVLGYESRRKVTFETT